ncbi:MAG: glycosyltransferase family 4 protein, partial [Planctomycetota bacterium]
FRGFEPDHEAIYPDIDIYVQASRRESMSNSVIEAMARGIPCVVSDVGGLPETVDDGRTGFVVPSDRPERYAEALDYLLSDRATFARFSNAAVERVRSDFDLAATLRRTVETVLGLSSSLKADS